MTSSKRSTSRLSALALGALLVGVPAAARAAEPTTADEAEAKAQQYCEQAARWSELGGPAYKTGSVQRAQAEAAKYDALADQLRNPPAAEPAGCTSSKPVAQNSTCRK